MFVGEQPGDQEDLAGRPFVGPAGQLLRAALAQAGINPGAVFLTNAVKHFKFELRGKRRLHKSPGQREAAACCHWLEDEIALVQPTALVALGARATRSLLGSPIRVTEWRGHWLMRGDKRPVFVTVHPSSILRRLPPDRAAAQSLFVDELRRAAGDTTAATPRAIPGPWP